MHQILDWSGIILPVVGVLALIWATLRANPRPKPRPPVTVPRARTPPFTF